MHTLIGQLLRLDEATLTCVQSTDLDLVRNAFSSAGWDIRQVDINGLTTESEIFLPILGATPDGDFYLEYHGNVHLDSLNDSLCFKDGDKIAILVEGAERLILNHLNTLIQIHTLCVENFHSDRKSGKNIKFSIVLFGNGPNFVDAFEEKSNKSVAGSRKRDS